MDCLLLGGTGAIGKHLAKFLAENKDNHVYITSRHSIPDNNNSHYLLGNAHDSLFLQRVLLKRDWDVIIDFMSYHTTEFLGRVDLLLQHTKQYIFLSSSRVYAYSPSLLTEGSSRLLDTSEDSVFLQTEEYALTKAHQEDILINNPHSNWTIIRPYITFGENRFQLGVLEKEYWLYRALHKRSIVFSKDIASKKTTLTWGHDVARGIQCLVGNNKSYGEIFHIVQPHYYSWSDILEVYLSTIEKKTGARPRVFWQDKSFRLDNKTERYQVLYDRLYDRVFDTSKIGKFIDINSFSDPLLKIADCLSAFLDNPTFLPFSSREEGFFDRLTHENTPRDEFLTTKRYMIYLMYRYMNPIARLFK